MLYNKLRSFFRPPVHATMESWLTLNWPSIVLFIYSFIFLFYMGEWLDNHRRVDLKILLPMLCSMVINTMLAGWAQVVGLFNAAAICFSTHAFDASSYTERTA